MTTELNKGDIVKTNGYIGIAYGDGRILIICRDIEKSSIAFEPIIITEDKLEDPLTIEPWKENMRDPNDIITMANSYIGITTYDNSCINDILYGSKCTIM